MHGPTTALVCVRSSEVDFGPWIVSRAFYAVLRRSQETALVLCCGLHCKSGLATRCVRHEDSN